MKTIETRKEVSEAIDTIRSWTDQRMTETDTHSRLQSANRPERDQLFSAVAEFAEVVSLSREKYTETQTRREIAKCRKLLKAAGVPNATESDIQQCLPWLPTQMTAARTPTEKSSYQVSLNVT